MGIILLLTKAYLTIGTLARPAFADDYLQLITTLSYPRDSTRIAVSSITNIGDFDADGYGDMAVGLRASWLLPFEDKVYLYRGGPAFDTIPDWIFIGDPDNPDLCPPRQYQTGFGFIVVALGDFNGDTFDDVAISASGLCVQDYHQGRIYIYFGGPNPDTIADLTVTGTGWHGMGYSMAGGDFNGDGLGDLLAADGDYFISSFHNYIFYGNRPPDMISDKLYNFDSRISSVYGGFDPNADGYDDFGWEMWWDTLPNRLYLGNDTLPDSPVFIGGPSDVFLPFDVSGDSIDDFFLSQGGDAYLCLGGNPLDFEPDYPATKTLLYNSFRYHRVGLPDLIMARYPDWRWPDLSAYRTGIPFDTIPYATFDYGFEGTGLGIIGDINADGVDEIAVALPLDTTVQHINIYGIATTGAHDGGADPLPNVAGILRCYPNPFNAATTITVQGMEEAEIAIYDIAGRRVATLRADGGRAVWQARGLSSGVYFARAGVNTGASNILKLVLVK